MSFLILGKLDKASMAAQDFLVNVQKALKRQVPYYQPVTDLNKKEWMEKGIQKTPPGGNKFAISKGWDNSIVKQQGITCLPNLLIGPDKRVVTQDIRGKELIDKVKQLIEQA